MRPEIGIPMGTITGLGGQAAIFGAGLPIVWWIGAVILFVLSFVAMAWLIANGEKKADEEWIYVVWTRPATMVALADYCMNDFSKRPGQTKTIPRGTVGHITEDNDYYVFTWETRRGRNVHYKHARVHIKELMHARGSFDIATNNDKTC